MTFEQWMRAIGLSESSVKKYSTAINGSLSDWGRKANLFEGSITDISDSKAFALVASKLKYTEIFIQRNAIGNQMYSGALKHYESYLFEKSNPVLSQDVLDILAIENTVITEKIQLINARIGQGKFRLDLLEFWQKCSVTGYQDNTMLIASHIKPWSLSTDAERLDKYNGLLLLPNLDRGFDSGLISFRDDGQIMISSKLGAPMKLGINDKMSVKLAKKHKRYMEFHRDVVFKS